MRSVCTRVSDERVVLSRHVGRNVILLQIHSQQKSGGSPVGMRACHVHGLMFGDGDNDGMQACRRLKLMMGD
jgi:hypothetical protein